VHVDFTNSGLTIPSGTEVHALMGSGNYPSVEISNRNYYDLGTAHGFTTKMLFLGDISKYKDSEDTFPTYENIVDITDAWYFRGTPNSWGAAAMELSAQGLWETIQTFGENSPRFKISHYTDNWNEAYPSSDYLITQGAGIYTITFDSASKQVVGVVKQGAEQMLAIYYKEF
jgi:hypothetical protein